MTEWVTGVVESVGYGGILLLMVLEIWLPVVQSEVVMTFAGFAARTGELSLVGAVVAGLVGTQVGSVTLYAASRLVPEPRVRALVERYGGWIGLDGERLDDLEDRFRRHDVRTVVVGRFLPGVRGVIAVPAGLLGMGAGRFLVASLAGAVVWTTGLTLGGYLLGSQYRLVDRYSGWVTAVLGVLLAVVAATWAVRVRRRRRAAART